MLKHAGEQVGSEWARAQITANIQNVYVNLYVNLNKYSEVFNIQTSNIGKNQKLRKVLQNKLMNINHQVASITMCFHKSAIAWKKRKKFSVALTHPMSDYVLIRLNIWSNLLIQILYSSTVHQLPVLVQEASKRHGRSRRSIRLKVEILTALLE